ncbi:nuclear transport factor 2 family protein [Sphingobium algorifonticola]|uniref:Nuclear transport factor 2 family protein n=1 Tax=Sphingobium algorifonticola TaxID=2008318 RepID=A0A437J3M9_9SPHN|nr:nuclear transport factor 2 family protein [Sphingobium algorifonticola]RVT39156.1 nuclear transport factor 2 family protein [Sphingobium algorifonticola]
MNDSRDIAALIEKDRLTQLIHEFGWGLDSGDWDLYRACLCDRVRIDFERLTGFPEVEVAADDWTDFARHALAPVRRHHAYSNIQITLDGHRAKARVHMTARHFLPSDNGAAHNTQYGWYDFDFVLMSQGWKIAGVRHWFQWVSGNVGLFDFSREPVASAVARVFDPSRMVKQ